MEISGNTSAGSGGVQGIGLRKQGTDPTIHSFGVEGMAATASPGVETYVSGQNPAANGTFLISASSRIHFVHGPVLIQLHACTAPSGAVHVVSEGTRVLPIYRECASER